MATKKKSAKKPAAGAQGASPKDRLVDALLAEAAGMGWGDVTLDAVAARAEIPLGEVLAKYRSKTAILGAFISRVDAASVGDVTTIDVEDTARDRLFALIMRRFDALQENRDGARAIITGLWRDPVSAVCVLPQLRRSAAITLEAAGISTHGLRGLARIKGFKLVMASAVRAWVNDDSSDMAKTMAAVDRALNCAERAEQFISTKRWKPQAEAA